jgi:acetylglutamate kinase
MTDTCSIIKIGGQVLDDEAAYAAFVRDFAALPGLKLLVHGGGKIATELGKRLGLEARYVGGRRVTDAGTLELVTMVYGGLINRQLVARLQAAGCPAIGLTGADANVLAAVRRPVGAVDYGWVGDPSAATVGTEALRGLWSLGLVPVLAPLTHDGAGQLLNTNADTIASVVAQALAPFYRVHLVFCFEKRGVLTDPAREDSALPTLSRRDYARLVDDATVSGGMLPKLENAFTAVEHGVERVIIGQAGDLLQNIGEHGLAGTLLTR